jgi:putative addiction module killer protein
VIEIKQTEAYEEWFNKLYDLDAQTRIDTRILRLSHGNPGDVNSVGEGVMELKINYGAGYRVYYVQRGKKIIILLAGGDKSTQRKDITAAKRLAKEIFEEV